MGIHSFLKAEKGDPDWQFSPEDYFGKEFKIIDNEPINVVTKHGEKLIAFKLIPAYTGAK